MNETQHIRIVTPRLRMDRLVPADAALLFSYRSDKAVARYQGWCPATLAEVAAFIDDQTALEFGKGDAWCQLALRERDSGDLVGDIGVHFPASTQEAIEFGVTIRPPCQGRGYAREALGALLGLAFGEWGYRRCVASVDPRNVASVALLRSLGFRQEAHHVESLFFRGEWVDDAVFAMLAAEWPGTAGGDGG